MSSSSKIKKTKLLFVVTEDWYFVSHRLPLAIEAKKAGYIVTVATRLGPHADTIRNAGIRLIPIDLSRRFGNPILEFYSLIKLYRSERPDILHHVAMKPVLYGSLAARLAKVPAQVNAVAGLGWLFISDSKAARFGRPLIRWALSKFLRIAGCRVIVQNPDDAMLLKQSGVPESRLRLVRGVGVDTSEFSPDEEPAGSISVMLASRVLWDKGVGEFVSAARQLKKEGVKARFILVGDPDPANPASVPLSTLHAWKNEGVVECWGHSDDMSRVFKHANIFCLPSYREGLPRVLLEAASCGRPIVTTNVPGCKEVVREGDNGFLVPIRDAKALASALLRLIKNPELRAKMGQRSREIVQKEFSSQDSIEKTLLVYKELGPKILFVVTEDWYFVSHRLPLAIAAKKSGYRVSVVTRLGRHADTIRNSGLRLIAFDMSRRLGNPLGELFSLVRLYRNERPDIVHHVAMKPVLYGSLAARLAGVPAQVNAVAGLGWLFISDSNAARFGRPLIRWALSRLLRIRGCRVIVQNPDDAKLLKEAGVPESCLRLVRGVGVNTTEFGFAQEPEAPISIVMAARTLWIKGVGDFVDAARQLKKDGVNARFILVGYPDAGNPASVPISRLESWQNEGVLECWGHHEDMPRVIKSAHVVCLPSHGGEGVPKVLLEAASCGRPIVTTNVPGCKEVVREGDNGFLVPVRDAKALASALLRLIKNPELRVKMGQRSREIAVSEFSSEYSIKETLISYRELVE